MSEYYKAVRVRNLYDPSSTKPFRISRSKIEQFIKCPRCFYIDRRLGIAPPPGFPFTLNSAVDSLLKKEFDHHRKLKTRHPLMKGAGIKSVPFQHELIDQWRDSLRAGISHHHVETNLIISGGVDDVWIDQDGWLNIVDYKATSKAGAVTLDADWQIGYKRQIEIYQWLFRQNGFKVSDISYFVYCNGDSSAKRFDGRLEFDISILPYAGNDSWVEDVLFEISRTLKSDNIPDCSPGCDVCAYTGALMNVVHA